jgi:hypothetical protein
MKIHSIEVQNIKGISYLNHVAELSPNKVNILVAPNGFGKSSFAIAFKYLTESKIVLAEKHLHNKNQSLCPLIRLEINDTQGKQILTANQEKNEIRDLFDVFVINSQLKAAGTVKRFGGINVSKFSIDIESTILYEKIPAKSEFEYKKSKLNNLFGANSKVLRNISNYINDPRLFSKILNEINLEELKLARTRKPISDFLKLINNVKGKEENVLEFIDNEIDNFLRNNPEVKKLTNLILELNFRDYETNTQCFLFAWQIINVIHPQTRAQITKVSNYNDFLSFSDDTARFISDFNTTRFIIKPKADKGKLIIEWPKADEISNGQRDILNFVALLLKARLSLNKQNQILVIDEVFDYLDDANLLSFQYFLTNLIDHSARRNINLFPILLTHLDPNFFNHFCFSDGKLKVFYLKEFNVEQGVNLHKIIYKRENPEIKNELDNYFFHFHPDHIDITEKFEKAGLVKEWGDSKKFVRKIYREVTNYLDDKRYDPIAICFALRKIIEMKVFNRITNTIHQKSFLNVHGTKNKLLFAQNNLGIKVPETFFLLGIIYNTSLHLFNYQNISNALAFKLENLTIKNLISETFKE